MKKLIALASSALLASALLSSCAATVASSSSAAASGTADAAAPAKTVELSVATRFSGDDATAVYYRKMVDEFNAQNNGVHVTMDNINTESDYLNKLRTSFANGDTPNCFIEYGGSRVLDYLQSDALVDLKPYLDKDSAWYNAFYPSMWGTSKFDGHDGLYGIPCEAYIVVLYYNKDIFAKEGLTPPKSMDELMTVSEKLKSDGIQPFAVGEKDVYRFGHLHNCIVLKSLGTDAVEQLASRKLAYDSPEMMKTYQVISDMVNKGYLGDNLLSMDSSTENSTFENGGAAMHYEGSWYIANNLVGKDFYNKVGVVQFPYVNEAYKNVEQGGASTTWYVSKLNKSNEEIEASVSFLKYITSDAYFSGMNDAAAALFPRSFTAGSSTKANPLMDDVTKIASEATAMRGDIQNYDTDSAMLDTVRNALQSLAMGKTPQECADQIMQEVHSAG